MDMTTAEAKAVFNAAVAMVLRLRRAELSMGLSEVARASGLKFQAVQSYLIGDRNIHVANFVALAHALQITPADALAAASERVEKAREPA